jgi:hypothetical protein
MKKLLSLTLLTTILLAACGGPTASPIPTPDQTPSGTPIPTVPPSPDPTPSPVGEGIGHPTGPTDVILQYEVGGGFVPIDAVITQVPQFTLYGDGTAIWLSMEQHERIGLFGGTLPPLVHGRMGQEGIQALLRFALGQGRLAGAREHYGQDTCADCPTTTFRLNIEGTSKVVTVDALGEINEGADALDRNGFNLLAQTLSSFDEQARNGVAGDVSQYDPPAYRIVLSQAQPEMGEYGQWPWPDLVIGDFEEWEADWQRRAMLDRDHVASIVDVPNGGFASIMVEDPEGGLWTVGGRVLLPHEIGAGDDGGSQEP